MRILIVTNTYPPADITGVGALVYDLARRLDSEGHLVRVLTRTADPDDALASTTGGRKLLFPWHVARLFWRWNRRHDFDLVHVHESDGVLVCFALRLARWLGRGSKNQAGRPKLMATLQVSYRRERWSVRTLREVRSDGNNVGQQGKVLSRPTFSERVFAWTRAPLLSLLGRLTARLSDAVVAPSAVTAEELRQDYGCSVDGVIPNGVLPLPDEGRADDAIDGIPDEAPRVLYAGRLRTRKAVAVLVEAFARLRDRHPTARLVIAGDGEQRPALEAQAASLGLDARAIRFLGAVPRPDMVRWYRRADIFCLPSIYEGFPLAILEAMAVGLPVVTTTASGMPEAVVDGDSGLLVPPEDVDALSQALDRLLGDAEARRAMGQAAQRRAAESFAIRKISADYMEHWEKLLGSHGSEEKGGKPSASS